MKQYLKEYVEEVDELLKNDDVNQNSIDRHLVKINFFQHERLIHLIVTVFYALFVISFVFLSSINFLYIIPTFILIIFLIFYVLHYFFLENSVQYLYKQYDSMVEKYEKTKR